MHTRPQPDPLQKAVAWAEPHALPQPPQFAGSLLSSTQVLPQSVLPPVQVSPQDALEQTSPDAHAFPQAPQNFNGSGN